MRKLFCRKIIIKLSCCLAVCLFALSAALSAGASAYYPYGYNIQQQPVPSQNGYAVSSVATTFNGVVLPGARDFFLFRNELFIACEDGIRIVNVADVIGDGDVPTVYLGKLSDGYALKGIRGIFVDDDPRYGETLYLADYEGQRVIVCGRDGEIRRIILKPSADVFNADINFMPSKVLVDSAHVVYVCITTTTMGALRFDTDGAFIGFYGGNRVQRTDSNIFNAFLRVFLTRDQLNRRARIIPLQFVNFDIDREGFIYTVTEGEQAETDVVKKLNPGGTNVYQYNGFDNVKWGDYGGVYFPGQSGEVATSLIDIEVADNGSLFLLDKTMRRVFRYNAEGELLFAFGGGGNQKGLFSEPAALETYGRQVFVLDGGKGSITAFTLTEFGEKVDRAVNFFENGYYTEARVPWESVIAADAGYTLAYVGIGNAYLKQGNYNMAMSYFYGRDKQGYDRAFAEYRSRFIRENFVYIAAVFVALVVLGVVLDRWAVKRRKAAALADFDEMRHANSVAKETLHEE